MTKDEVKVILGVLKTAYPAFYKDLSREEAMRVVDLWSTMFSEESAEIVTEAVRALICTMKYPPTIADVKEKIREISTPESISEMEAWNIVKSAISYYHAKENFEKLPPLIKKVIGGPSQLRDWAVMDADTVNSVIQSNFMRSYTAIKKREESYFSLPQSTRKLIEQLSQKYKLTDSCRKSLKA